MKHFDLSPEQGWQNYSHNADLADWIYDNAMKTVNGSDWNYINPMSNMGIFEDSFGNYLCIETRDTKSGNVIFGMHCGFHDGVTSRMTALIKTLEDDYDIMRVLRD
jgi:hypothetical protein